MTISRIKEYILRRANSDCLVCYLRSALRGCKFVIPIAYACPHFDKTTSPIFTQSNIFKHLAYCLSMLMFLTCYLDLLLLVTGKPQYNNVNLAINDALLCFGVALAMLTGSLKLKYKIEELNGLSSIIEHRKLFYIRSFLSDKLILKTYLVCQAVIIYIAFSSCISVVSSCYQLGYNDITHIFKRIVTELCMYVEACHTLHMALMTVTYTLFITKCHKRIKKELTSLYMRDGRRAFVLRKLTCLHMVLTENFNRANGFSSSIHLIIWTLLILLLINNFYVFICSYVNDELSEKLYEALKLKVAFNCIACTGFLFLQQSLINLNHKILAFLHRYPASEMNRDELLQIEVLIMILDVQTPVVTVMDIFTVSVRLVPALAGTVITYLLVALQFYVTSLKNQNALRS